MRGLGFSDNEVKVYIALLKVGKSKAGRIAKECSLDRTSVYNSLKKLLEKGMVASILESSRQVFSPADPSKIIDFFREQEERAKMIVPELEKMKGFTREKENILNFRGFAGIKTVLNDILKSCKNGEEYLIMGSERQLSDKMPEFAQIFVARKDKKKLKAKILIRETLRSKVMSKYTKVRYLPSNIISPSVTNIYAGKVAIILWSEIPEAIIIDNEATAQTYKSYFEFMWANARE